MKKTIVLLASFALLTGCASTETIKRLDTQSGQGVFQVIKSSDTQAPAGYGDLQIALNVKTRNAGTVAIDTTGYGTDRYQLLIGINGQTQKVTGRMTAETDEYRGSKDPEAGDGTRYHFTTALRLPIGTHKVVFGLPGDGIVLEQDVVIMQGSNRLELKPAYSRKNGHRRIGFHGDTTYYEGVKALEVAGGRK